MNGREATRGTWRTCVQLLACFVFVCIYFVGIYPGAPDSNQRSHYQLLRALGERGTADIGPEVSELGWHTDIAIHAGRRLSDKAPGLSVAALPAYKVLRLFLAVPSSSEAWVVFYGARVLSVTLVVTLALGTFARQALRRHPVSPLLPLWLFALVFATPFQLYARSFFSHAFAAALVFLSFVLAVENRSLLSSAGAGFLASAAVATEYPLAVVALCLLIATAARGSAVRLAAFLVGAAPAAAALAWYHHHYFGSIFATPQASNASYPLLASRGLSGISWPEPSAILGLFLDPAHGLLYFSPYMVLWPVVAVAALCKLKNDPTLFVPALGPLLLLFVIAGFIPPHWRGGWCLGPRYLVASFLLVFWLFVVKIPSDGPRSERLLLLAGVVYATIILGICGSTYWLIPYESWNPVRTVSAHLLRLGIVEYNLGIAAGLPPLASLVPPTLACVLGLFLAVRAAAIPIRTVAAATLLGALAAAVVISIPPSPEAIVNSHRDGLASALVPAMRAGWR